MLNDNFEFSFNDCSSGDFSIKKTTIVFKENLSPRSSLIHTEAITRAQRYLIAEAELLEIIVEIDKERIFEELGLTHLTPYCVKHLGLSEDVAANFVRVARKSLHVPELKEAIEEGRISVTKAKTIASVITSENHSTWIDKAQSLTKDKLEREVANVSPQTRKPEKAKAQGSDCIRIEFELTDEEMKLFRRAQDLVSQKLSKSASFAETQMEMLKLFLKKNDPVKKAERAKIKSAYAKSNIEKTKPASDQSRDLSREKKSRKNIKSEVEHAVNLRDQGKCQALMPDGSVCTQTRWVHFHHIVPLARGGEDAPENLVTLCSSHHRLWHRGSGF